MGVELPKWEVVNSLPALLAVKESDTLKAHILTAFYVPACHRLSRMQKVMTALKAL